MRPHRTIQPSTRSLALALGLLAPLGACGEDRDDFAAARCKDALRQTLGAESKLDFPGPRRAALRDDPVYGWHLDLDVEAKLGAGETRRAGYRCLFVVENRDTPLFLAVVER
jgi:hypothetical protein